MPQYRLTKRFSEDCKIPVTSLPETVVSAIDDWAVDTFTIGKNQIAMATHARTLCTLLIPYSLAGSAAKALDLFPRLFAQFLLICGYSHLEAEQAYIHLSEQPAQYCKTFDKSILGVMSDFKRCAKSYIEGVPFADVDWGEVVSYLNEIPVNLKKQGFCTPRELLDSFLKKPQLLH
ncbi:MAG: hypothetical protein K0S08_2141 [Gammaproteobacteria bacterium]|jgi:hypothetical protein|nr:hypothetical protein [Gammaproteobacteria bacterium]